MSLSAWHDQERMYLQKAIQITGGYPPSYNIQPIVDLIRRADQLGFDVIPRRNDLAQQQAAGDGE